MKCLPALAVVTAVVALASGCSYGADLFMASVSDRGTFSLKVEIIDDGSGGTEAILDWGSHRQGSGDFAGYEIYRTSDRNDQFSDYELVAFRYGPSFQSHPNLGSISTKSFTDEYPPSSGSYFYRVGVVVWPEDEDERDGVNDYNDNTRLERISVSAPAEF